jgi:hypothetical protein
VEGVLEETDHVVRKMSTTIHAGCARCDVAQLAA